jgi:hypothetical protein
MIFMTFISIHFVIICDVLSWRTYETHLALSFKSGCDKRGPSTVYRICATARKWLVTINTTPTISIHVTQAFQLSHSLHRARVHSKASHKHQRSSKCNNSDCVHY